MADPMADSRREAIPAIRSQLVHQEGSQLVHQEGQDSQRAGGDFVGGSGFGQTSHGTYGGMSSGQMVMGSAMGAGGAQFGGGSLGGFGDRSISVSIYPSIHLSPSGVSSFGQPQPDRLDFGSHVAFPSYLDVVEAGGVFGSHPAGREFGGGGFGQPSFVSHPADREFGGGVFGQPQQFGSQDFGGGGFGQPVSVGFGAAPPTRENEAIVPPPLPPAGGLSTCACSRVCGCWICFKYQTQFYLNYRRQIMYQPHIN